MILLKTLLTKIGTPALLAAGIFAGGMFTQKKFTRDCPDCIPPACNCPQPTVSVQPFDVEKIKNLKAFTYSPEFTGAISVAGVDSTAIRKYVEQAVEKAFERLDKKKKRKISWLGIEADSIAIDVMTPNWITGPTYIYAQDSLTTTLELIR